MTALHTPQWATVVSFVPPSDVPTVLGVCRRSSRALHSVAAWNSVLVYHACVVKRVGSTAAGGTGWRAARAGGVMRGLGVEQVVQVLIQV